MLRRRFSAVVASCAFLLVAGCAAPGKPAPPPRQASADDAQLIIYRTQAAHLSARSAHFYLDEVHVASLDPRTHTKLSVPAGQYRIGQKWSWDLGPGKDMSMPVSAAPGQRRYFRLHMAAARDFIVSKQYRWELREVPEDEALLQMSGYEFHRALAHGAQ
jgi:hypothetical protein